MAELPPAMLRNNRVVDPVFKPGEFLYRRVPPEMWDVGSVAIELDAIELPDMSTMRSKHAHPEWARLESGCDDWGVVGFRVADIPGELVHLGVFNWSFRAAHVPLKKNYPHSEVRAFENGQHVSAIDRLTPDVHLRWREQLLREIRVFLRPGETAPIRQVPPA